MRCTIDLCSSGTPSVRSIIMIITQASRIAFSTDNCNSSITADAYITAIISHYPKSFTCRSSYQCAIISCYRNLSIRYAGITFFISECFYTSGTDATDAHKCISADHHLAAAFTSNAAGIISFCRYLACSVFSTANIDISTFTNSYTATIFMAVNTLDIITACLNVDLRCLTDCDTAISVSIQAMRYDTAGSIFYCDYSVAANLGFASIPKVHTFGAADIGSNIDHRIAADFSSCTTVPVFDPIDMP